MAKKSKRDWLKHPPNCTYCNTPAKLVSGNIVYPHRSDLGSLKYWICKCGARVGTHKNSPNNEPYGLLADAEHRKLKIKAHAAFDPIWRYGRTSRKEAYIWLRKKLGVKKDVHMGWAGKDELKRIIEICQARQAGPVLRADDDEYQDIHCGKI